MPLSFPLVALLNKPHTSCHYRKLKVISSTCRLYFFTKFKQILCPISYNICSLFSNKSLKEMIITINLFLQHYPGSKITKTE